MWPFRRRETPSGGNGPVVVQRARRTDWQSVPPMHLAPTESFMTVEAGFERQLATRQRPLFLQPLGHHLAPGAPAGVVSGLAKPMSFAAAPRGVQRVVASAPESVGTPTMSAAEARPVTVLEDRARIADGRVAPARSLIEATAPDLPPVVAPTVATAVVADPERSETADAAIDPVTDAPALMPSAVPLATQRAVLDQPVPPATPVQAVPTPARAVSPASDSSVASVPGNEVSPAPGSPSAAPAVVSRSIAAPAPVASRTVAAPAPAAAPVPAVSRTIGFPAVAAPTAVVQGSGTSRSSNVSDVAVQKSAPASTRPSLPPIGSPDPAPGSAVVGATVPTGGLVEPTVAHGADDLRSDGPEPSEHSTDSHDASAGADATDALPLIGSVPLVPSPAPIQPSPSDVSSDLPLPPATTSATTAIPVRRTMIGEPLESGGGTVARMMGDDPGRTASIAAESAGPGTPTVPATAPTLGTQRSILPTSGTAGSTDGPATGPPPAPDADAVPIRHASSAAASTATETPVLARPLVAASYAPPPAATLDVPAPGRPTVVGPVVARRVDTAAPGPTSAPPGDGTEPDRRADPGPTSVMSLLADRPLLTMLDGHTTTAGAALPSEPVTARSTVEASGPSSRRAGLPPGGAASVVSGRRVVVPAVQRTVTGVPAGASVPRPAAGRTATARWRDEAVTPIASRPFAAGSDGFSVLSPNIAFAPREDGTLWAADDTTAPVALQREPDETSAAEAAPALAPQTTTAVATAGPAAPATEAKPRSEAELQELCRALYPPLRRRLCRDLLVDRERAGYRTDIRF